MANTDLSDQIGKGLDEKPDRIPSNSLLGKSINIPVFLDLFRSGAARNQGRASTIGAKYSSMGDRFCIPNLEDVCREINGDPAITDVRWAGYMLATSYWETAHVVDSGIPRKKPKTGNYKVPETFVPISESVFGNEHFYGLPVKVARAPSGHALVTDRHGQVFDVNPSNGKILKVSLPHGAGPSHSTASVHPTLGAARLHLPVHAAATRKTIYDQAFGTPLIYYGRGYTQLTWWVNYVAAGVVLGRGLDLLFNPELALQPQIAYAVMSIGMREGVIFANGHKLIDYFNTGGSDYVGARHMVNSTDHAPEIAAIAEAITQCLLESLRV